MESAMSQKFLFPILLFTVTIAVAACGEKIEPGNAKQAPGKAVKASVGTAIVSQQPFIYEAVATVVARTASTLSSKLMGTVREVHVREGDLVKEGDLLVVIDQRSVDAGREKARAGLTEAQRAEASAASARAAAKAAAELASSTYQRYLTLRKDESASQQEFDEIESRHRQAQATLAQTESMLAAAASRVEQARAALDEASVSQKDATIRAPYAGKITAKMIDEGDLASPGTPFLTIEKEGVFCADLVLPEEHIQAVKLDQEVKVAIPSLGDAVMTGTVGRIVPTADPKSRSIMVKVALPEHSALKSGMFARVSVPVGKAGMILIPATAVIPQGQLTGLFIVDENQIARFRLIRTGLAYGDALEVLSGLHPGDRYVIAPPATLKDGDSVEVSA
jgi:multidrug efflux pump subunit AcrA (membrane-fusion protein)